MVNQKCLFVVEKNAKSLKLLFHKKRSFMFKLVPLESLKFLVIYSAKYLVTHY